MSQSKNTSHRHHFVPQFYLREWHDPSGEGFWLYTRDRNGQIKLHRRPAKSIAYVEDLYSLLPDGLTFDHSVEPDVVERDFFSRIDNEAAKVHQKILLQGIKSLHDNDKRIFAVFVNSLLERHPKRIEELVKGVDTEKIWSDFQKRWPAASWQKNINIEAAVRNTALRVLASYIMDEPFIEHALQMQWMAVDLPPGHDHFLTGDTPVVVNGGVSDPRPIYVLSIALSPIRLLVVHTIDNEFDQGFIERLTQMHSVKIATQTQVHLISSRRIVNSSYIKYARALDERFAV